MDRPLDLDDAVPLHGRDPFGKGEIGVLSPRPVACIPLAGFIPALNEIVMHVHDGGATDLGVDVVVMPFTSMTRRDH